MSDDELSGDEIARRLDPRLTTAVDAVMAEVRRGFEVLWSRPDAPLIMARFAAGTLTFSVERGGLRIDDRTGEDPLPGMYL